MSPSEVTELLDLKIADENIEPRLVSDERSDKISFMVSDVGRKDMNYPLLTPFTMLTNQNRPTRLMQPFLKMK